MQPSSISWKACNKRNKLSVEFIVGLLADGADFKEIIDEYHTLKEEDILACLKYASKVLEV